MKPGGPADQLADRLAQVLAPVLGPVAVEGLRALTGGASRTTWAFEAVRDKDLETEQRRSLILRTGPVEELNATMELEAHAQCAAAGAGAPVPTVLIADNSPAALGNPYLICDEIAGETVVRRIERQLDDTGRAHLLGQCAQALAAIHRADPAGIALSAEDQLSACRNQLDTLPDTTAPFEWALRRLASDRPPPVPPQLVHGDFRMGNLMVSGEGDLAAVLDWELVHLGDGCEDLAWFCVRAWRFGAPVERAAGGLGSIDDFLAAYQQAAAQATAQAGDWHIDPDRFDWWLMLSTLRWGIICRYQAQRHLSGQTRSVELATIGRRVSETEWDLLRLLDGVRP